MPKYFIDLPDTEHPFHDEDGRELRDSRDACRQAVLTLLEMGLYRKPDADFDSFQLVSNVRSETSVVAQVRLTIDVQF